MPNPILPPQTFEPPPPRMPTQHNGILAWVPGHLIGGADLPPAGPKQPAERHVTVEVPDIGLVRITYQLASYRRGKSRNWHWAAVRADEVKERP